MNMQVRLSEETYTDYAPRSVKGRLREYCRYRGISRNAWPQESPLFAVLHAPGRATNGAQDGGMAARIDQMGFYFAKHARVLELRSLLILMPQICTSAVVAMYEAADHEPRSERAAAEKMGISRAEYVRHLERAFGWLEREMGIPRD